jgi:hypothetical protein
MKMIDIRIQALKKQIAELDVAKQSEEHARLVGLLHQHYFEKIALLTKESKVLKKWQPFAFSVKGVFKTLAIVAIGSICYAYFLHFLK